MTIVNGFIFANQIENWRFQLYKVIIREYCWFNTLSEFKTFPLAIEVSRPIRSTKVLPLSPIFDKSDQTQYIISFLNLRIGNTDLAVRTESWIPLETGKIVQAGAIRTT